MSGGGSTTQTTTQQAPSWQLPYQQYGLNQAYSQYQNVNSPTQLVSPFSSQQNQAISNITDFANGNNPVGNASNAYIANTLSGSPANNPYLNSEFNLAANGVQNRLESEFAGSGRNVEGSLPVQADQMNNLATQFYGGAYNTGVQQQEQAAALAPGAQQQTLANQQGLFNAGQQIQNLGQQYIQAPQTFLNQYLSQANGNLGSTYSQPLYFDQGLMGLGGAALGQQAGSAIGNAIGGQSGQGYGSLLGTLGGGLLGYFS